MALAARLAKRQRHIQHNLGGELRFIAERPCLALSGASDGSSHDLCDDIDAVAWRLTPVGLQ
ncbi:hypothetical protein ACU8V6_00040 [Vibrio alginolyticus]